MAAEEGKVEELIKFRDKGFDFTLSDYDGRTVLHFAASGGHLNCVKYLLEECDLPGNVSDRWGNGAIHEAEAFGHTAVVKYLREWLEKHNIEIMPAKSEKTKKKTDK